MIKLLDYLLTFSTYVLFGFVGGVKVLDLQPFVVYEENAIDAHTKMDHFDKNHSPHFDKDRSDALIHDDLLQSTREMASMMDCEQSTIVRHSYSIGKIVLSEATTIRLSTFLSHF